MADEEKDDLYYLNQWKQHGKKEDFQALYRRFGGLINEASKKAAYGSNIPQAVFKMEAAQRFHDSLQAFNPDRGVQLKTYLYGNIENKLKRLNYTYQNLARTPERATGGVYHYTQFKNEKSFLEDKLGREPSTAELADNLGWSVKQVERMLAEDRRDLSLNAELEDLNTLEDFSGQEAELAMHYYDMDPEEQRVFDYTTGSHGRKPILKPSGKPDYKAIARSLGMDFQKFEAIRKRLVRRIEKKRWGI